MCVLRVTPVCTHVAAVLVVNKGLSFWPAGVGRGGDAEVEEGERSLILQNLKSYLTESPHSELAGLGFRRVILVTSGYF